MKQQAQTKQLPKGWKEDNFTKCFKNIPPTNKIQKKNYLEGGILPIVDQGEGLIAGYIEDNLKKQRVNLPVIIFGDHTRRFKFVDFDFVAGADGIKIFQINDNLNPKFAYYQCLTLDFPNKGYSRHFQYLKKTNLVYPQFLSTQSLIVSAIETQFSRLEEAVKVLKSVKDKLRIYRKAVLKKAFEKKEGWEKSFVGKQAKVRYGKGLPERDRINSGEIPVFGSSGKVGNHNQSLINFNTIIIARKGSVGNNFVIKEPCWPIDTTYYLEDINLDIDYLYYFLNSSIFKDTSTAIPSLRRYDLESIKISFPSSITEQQKIVSFIESKFSVIDKVEEVVNQSLLKAEKLRKSILKTAFEGKLVKINQ